jgi:hypothetical protein
VDWDSHASVRLVVLSLMT